MSDAFAPFQQVLDDRHGYIRAHKEKSGRRVAGYFCDYLPEEVLWAAGMTPIRITGGRGNVTLADRYMQSNVCSFARRCLEQALEGTYQYIDTVAVPHTCDVITKMHDLWAYRLPYPDLVHYLWVPHKVFDKDAVGVMTGEIKRMKKAVEEFTGAAITDEALTEAIRVYDRSRALLRRVYDLRLTNPPRISGAEAFGVALSSVLAPKDEHSDWMEALLKERESAEAGPKRPRVLVSASMLDDLDLVRAVEDAGAWVVADDVCTGSRYFWDLVGDDEGAPIKALTRRYLNKVPCPRSVDSMTPRWNHLQGMAKDYAVDGIIFYILRCCDAHLFQYPMLKERAEKAGLKVLYLQGDQTVGINESMINRIQAFTEMLST